STAGLRAPPDPDAPAGDPAANTERVSRAAPSTNDACFLTTSPPSNEATPAASAADEQCILPPPSGSPQYAQPPWPAAFRRSGKVSSVEGAGHDPEHEPTSEDRQHLAEVERWRAHRLARLRSPDGWLAVVG